jgi:hypothetical protein
MHRSHVWGSQCGLEYIQERFPELSLIYYYYLFGWSETESTITDVTYWPIVPVPDDDDDDDVEQSVE